MKSMDINLLPYSALNIDEAIEYIPYGVKLIQAPQFWDNSKKGEWVVIAVIDTVCDINHPDLKDKIIGLKTLLIMIQVIQIFL